MKAPKEYEDKIMELGQHYYHVLDGLIKLYPQYKVNPNVQNILKEYTSDKETFLDLQEELFLLKNNIEKDSEDLEKQIVSMNTKITVAERNNVRLTDELARIKNSGQAAEQLLQDTQYLHNEDLTANIVLFLVIIGLSIGFYNLKK
jgi:hypothetical protein